MCAGGGRLRYVQEEGGLGVCRRREGGLGVCRRREA